MTFLKVALLSMLALGSSMSCAPHDREHDKKMVFEGPVEIGDGDAFPPMDFFVEEGPRPKLPHLPVVLIPLRRETDGAFFRAETSVDRAATLRPGDRVKIDSLKYKVHEGFNTRSFRFVILQ